MSGPKVVRVVTREELVAAAKPLLTQLNQALAQWHAAATSAGASAEEVAATTARHEAIVALLESDQFSEFNRAALREKAFLTDAADQQRERAAVQRAEVLAGRLRTRQNATLLLQSLAGKGIAIDTGLQATLESASKGRAEEGLAAQALAAGFQLLAPQADPRQASSAQMAQARRLLEAGDEPSVEQWKKNALGDAVDARLQGLTQQLERLRELLGQAPAVADVEHQLSRALAERNDNRRNLLLDTLQVDLAAAVQSARAYAALGLEATALSAALSDVAGEQARAAHTRLQACVASGDAQRLAAEVEACRALLQSLAQAEAAKSRRDAVLKGLAALGYAVHEGMETAWVEQGRVVVQKPGLEGYGVELAGAPAAERLQVRTVALAHQRDTSRDIDAEQLWCNDFSQLKSDLAIAGSQVLIDRAMGVGVVPLKVVEEADAVQRSRGLSTPLKKAH